MQQAILMPEVVDRVSPWSERVDAVQQEWSEAILSKDPERVLARYRFPVLFKPTLSDSIRTTREEALRYFVGGNGDPGFLKKGWTSIKWQRKALQTPTTPGGRVVDMGHYWFSGPAGTEKVDYTFAYVPVGNDLLIDVHHSSLNVAGSNGSKHGWILPAGAFIAGLWLLSHRGTRTSG